MTTEIVRTEMNILCMFIWDVNIPKSNSKVVFIYFFLYFCSTGTVHIVLMGRFSYSFTGISFYKQWLVGVCVCVRARAHDCKVLRCLVLWVFVMSTVDLLLLLLQISEATVANNTALKDQMTKSTSTCCNDSK